MAALSQQTVGKSPPRSDGPEKVSGAAQFVDDMQVEGLWHGATVRAPHAHARILAIDAAPAVAEDPEVVVLTAKDLPGPNVIKLIVDDWPVLADGEVIHAYQAVALVAAPSRERALAAAARVHVDYEVLPADIGIDAALARGAEGVLARCAIDHGDVDAAFSRADVRVLEGTYETGYQEHLYIETNGAIAWAHADGSLEVVGSLQCPYYVHQALTSLFELSDEAVRVRQTTTGGGFGGKEDYPDMIAAHAALLAKRVGRPVKIIYERHEDLVATTKRHPSRVVIKSAVLEDGTFVAHDILVLLDGGATTTLSPVVLSRAVLHAAGAYRCTNVRVRGRALRTHTVPNGAFRGFGAPQSEFAIERHVDRVARILGQDPLSLRLHNAYAEGDVTPTGQLLKESVSARACLTAAAEKSDYLAKWQRYEAERAAGRPDDGKPWRGIGLSLFWHGAGFTGNGEQRIRAKAAVVLREAGEVEVRVASTDIGQGTLTVFEMIGSDALGVPRACVHMSLPDTRMVPDSGPTVASRTVMVVGELVARAAHNLGEKLCAFAAAKYKARNCRLEGGQLHGEGVPSVSFLELSAAYLEEHGPLTVEESFRPLPGQDFDETTYRGMAYPAYGWGCDVVEVEVDPDTLQVRPLAVTAVCEVGKVIHPVLCTGQVDGGTLQAIAWGYMEEIKVKDGRYQNDRLATYIIPTSRDVPDIHTVLLENPAPAGPFGAKGVGELPMDGGAPALVSAIENAVGIVTAAIPATPERLHQALLGGNVLPGAPQVNDAAGGAS